ncbi:co-chaperone [Babesia ovis]|uniref:GrpE protein homolog n=1 Tax=Babesia ovis TaxID=5869 RepID=A0A9W5WUM4_BABOV|nr:co-chaperone [Babesia ovis]
MIANNGNILNRTAALAFRNAFRATRAPRFYSAIQSLCFHGNNGHIRLPTVQPNLCAKRYFSADANTSEKVQEPEKELEAEEHTDHEPEAAENEAVDLNEKVADLEAKLAEITENLKELQLKYRISLDTCEQIERISEHKLHNAKLYAITQFAKDMLDVADAFELAFKSLDEQKDADINNKFIEGIRLTEAQLHKTFEKYGIKRFDSLNQVFNPEVHEAMFEIQDDSVDKNTVLQVIFNGYTIKDRILRAAKVGVSRK